MSTRDEGLRASLGLRSHWTVRTATAILAALVVAALPAHLYAIAIPVNVKINGMK